MAISVNWGTKVIYVPKADLTPLGGVLYGLDLDDFRLALKNLEDSDEGMPFLDTHRHNTSITLSGVTYSRFVEIINGYTVEFEDGQYTVVCSGANHNLADVKVANQVSLIIGNAAGLITVTSGSGLSGQEHEWLERTYQASEIKRATIEDTDATKTSFKTSLSETIDDFWVRGGILFLTGQCQGQIRGVSNYVAVDGVITLETPLSYEPADGDVFIMIPSRKYLAPGMNRVLGLVQENFRMKDQIYDGDGNLTSATVRIYANATNADNDVNPIAEYMMTASFAGPGQCTGYVMKEA